MMVKLIEAGKWLQEYWFKLAVVVIVIIFLYYAIKIFI